MSMIEESNEIKRLLNNLVDKEIDEKSKECLRLYKAVVTSVATQSGNKWYIGVKIAPHTTAADNSITILSTYMCKNCAVGDYVWVAKMYNSMNNAFAMYPMDFIFGTDYSGSGNYLPLSAGSSYPLTGTLYTQAILPNIAGYQIGSATQYFSYMVARNYWLKNNTNNYSDTPTSSSFNEIMFLDKSNYSWAGILSQIANDKNLLSFYITDKNGTGYGIEIIDSVNGGVHTHAIRPGGLNNDIDLGGSSNRWKDYYGGGNIYLGETSAVDKNIVFQTNGVARSKITGHNGGTIVYQAPFHRFATLSNTNALIIDPTNNVVKPNTPNVYDLGASNNTFKDLYLGGAIKDGTNIFTLPSASGTLALTNDISNPNLLINSNFAINQRGQASYTTNGKYTVDRWKLSYGKLEVQSVGVKYTSANTWQGIVQIIEKPSQLAGKTLTFSVNGRCESGSIMRIYIYYQYSGQSRVTVGNSSTTSSSDTTIFCSGSIPSNITDNDTIYVMIQTSVANNTFYVNFAKLEIGDKATTYTPPLIAEELVKCQRYYWEPLIISNTNNIVIGSGVCYSGTYAYFSIPIPTMRTTGGTFTAQANKLKTYTTGTATPSAVVKYSQNANCLGVRTQGSYTAGQSILLLISNEEYGVINLDAEIY